MMEHCFLCEIEYQTLSPRVHGFCGACASTAMAKVANMSTNLKRNCHKCGKTNVVRTLRKYGGFCRVCFIESLRLSEPEQDNSDNEVASNDSDREPSKLLPGTKRRKAVISAALRMAVWKTYGSSTYYTCKCWCCDVVDIEALYFDCGHVIAEAKGGSTMLENLRPVCRTCNTSMGTNDMRVFAAANGLKGRILSVGVSAIPDELSSTQESTTQKRRCRWLQWFVCGARD